MLTMHSLALVTLLTALTTGQWLDDFHQVIAEMTSHYANLESAVHDRKIDLQALKKRAEDQIAAAHSDAEAHRAIENFLDAFGDGHVEVQWPKSSDAEKTPSPSLCARLHYVKRDFRGIEFGRAADYTPISDADSNDFPGGILRIAGKAAGVVRIHLFSETGHPDLCVAAEKKLALDDAAPCDDNCEDRLQSAVADLLTESLERRLASLQKAGATTLIVDVTGNGGGSNWVEPAARVMTPIALRSPRLGFIRHPHWVKQLSDRLEDVQKDRKRAPDDALLASAESLLQRALNQARQPCDRGALWGNPASGVDCSLVVGEPLYATGILPYAKPGSLSHYQSAGDDLFLPGSYRYDEGANRLPLIVLVDENTASAAEYFAAMLQDNHAATIVGIPTFGAGCGHTNGGIDATLHNSAAQLRLPDCVRYRADGSNEVSGVTPDVLISWSQHDSRYQRAVKTRDALRGLLK